MKRRHFIAAGLAGAGLIASGLTVSGLALAQDNSVLRVGLHRAIPGLDPSVAGGELTNAIFDTLTTLNDSVELEPGLATAWERLDDLTWRFTLREGVQFSDGSEFTGQSLVDYIALLVAEDSTLATSGRWRQVVASAELAGPLTVDIRTQYPYLGLPDRVTTLLVGKFDADAAEIHNKWIGTGPYRLTAVDIENGASAVINEHYWGEAPSFERLEYSVLASEESRVLALQAQEIDVVVQIDPRTVGQFASSDYYRTGSKPSTWNIILRIKERADSPLSDVRVRQAINYGIDKQAIIAGLFQGSVEPSPGQFLVKGWDYVNPNLQAFPYDVEKAKALLAEAGYAEGVKLRLDVPNGSYLAVAPAAQVIAAQLQLIGVEIEINTLPFATWVDESRKPDVGDLVYIGHSTAYKVTPERLSQFKSSYDQSHWEDLEFDAAADRALAAQTQEEQEAALDEATEIFNRNLHGVFLYPQPVTWAVRQGLVWEPRIDQRILPQTVKVN